MGTGMGYSRVFTSFGNFSAITGKSVKSKKTFLSSMFIASALHGGYFEKVFEADLPSGRRGVLLLIPSRVIMTHILRQSESRRCLDIMMINFWPLIFGNLLLLKDVKIVERA